MTALIARELTGGYTRAPVLRGIDITVHADEFVGLLGANGAGKTTTLRALSGTLPTCQGEIRVGDRDITRLAPWKRVAVGFAHVPEGRHVFRAMSVQDNLATARPGREQPIDLDGIYEIFPRLRERRDQLAGSLSGGEQQMVAIARGLMTAPLLLAIDELSAGLAPVLVEQLVDALARLRGTGIALLIVEQSPHFVSELLDRVYLLEQGSVVGTGTLDDLGGPGALAALYLGVS